MGYYQGSLRAAGTYRGSTESQVVDSTQGSGLKASIESFLRHWFGLNSLEVLYLRPTTAQSSRCRDPYLTLSSRLYAVLLSKAIPAPKLYCADLVLELAMAGELAVRIF